MDDITTNAADYARKMIEGEKPCEDVEKIPQEVEELIQRLDELFPERLPHITEDSREFLIYIGQRETVNYLKRWQTASKEK